MALLNEINVKGVPHPIVTDDGYYQEMTVGDAEQLVATTFTEDDAPYNFRTAGGAIDIGDRKQVKGLVGGTIAWNQLVRLITTGGTVNGLTYTPDPSTGIVTVDGTSTGRSNMRANLYVMPFISGHKYLVSIGADGGSLSGYHGSMVFYNDGTYVTYREFVATATIVSYDFNANKAALEIVGAGSEGVTLSNVKFIPQFIDLTQLFGSTIADYIYALEQSQAGAGVAWFKKYFPKPYYAYNAGKLMSVKALRHITRGFNQFDKSTAINNKRIRVSDGTEQDNASWARSDYIRVVPNTVYYTNADGTGQDYPITFYDANKTYIGHSNLLSAGTFNTGEAQYLILSTLKAITAVDDLVLNLSWDGERDGDYEEYSEHVYELDPDLELRGIPKLSAGNDLYYDGDVYPPSGEINRRYTIVDLGTLTWYLDVDVFYAIIPNCKVRFEGICEKYPRVDVAYAHQTDKTWQNVSGNGSSMWVKDSAYTDAATFKAAMSGVYLAYERATPTTETAEPYNGTQIVDDFGTEEFVDAGVAAETRDVAIPVGHNSLYQPNLRAKLEMVPEAPEDEGYYVVYHHNGINEYVPLIIPQELPNLPSEDGTYTLKCTVASGSATLSFESEV